MKIIADASLPDLKTLFPKPFILELYKDEQSLKPLLQHADALLCRSSLKVNEHLLSNTKLRYVATASAGIDHVDSVYLQQRNIRLFSAKGANASAVADYVMSSLAFLQSQHLLNTKEAGIIGLGHVGREVAQRLKAASFSVVQYDPLKAMKEPEFHSDSLEQLQSCKLICIHANLHEDAPYPSKHLIDRQFLKKLPKQSIIINAARGGVVCEQDLVNSESAITYCTDVYENEPDINKAIVAYARLATPHIAGHSIEAKLRALHMISRSFHELLHLPPPDFEHEKPRLEIPELPTWDAFLLSLYNPEIESIKLKNAQDLSQAFKHLRKQHKNRHDFKLLPYSGTFSNLLGN